MIAVLGPGDWWRDEASKVGAVLTAPTSGPVALWAMGWDPALPALAQRGTSDLVPFVHGPGRVAACFLPEGATADTIRLSAPTAPVSCLAFGRPQRPATLAGLLPRCARPARGEPPAAAEVLAEVEAALERGSLWSALGSFAEARLADADPRAWEAAGRRVLLHLARHPLDRDPALGAFVAALGGRFGA
jgi:hypothetical protein